MGTRIILQIFLFSLPFIVFFIYTILFSDFKKDGKKTWPLNVLFLTGTAFFIAGWLVMVFLNQQTGPQCLEPPRIENGQIIPAKQIPCEIKLDSVGRPLTEDPGGIADGIGDEGES